MIMVNNKNITIIMILLKSMRYLFISILLLLLCSCNNKSELKRVTLINKGDSIIIELQIPKDWSLDDMPGKMAISYDDQMIAIRVIRKNTKTALNEEMDKYISTYYSVFTQEEGYQSISETEYINEDWTGTSFLSYKENRYWLISYLRNGIYGIHVVANFKDYDHYNRKILDELIKSFCIKSPVVSTALLSENLIKVKFITTSAGCWRITIPSNYKFKQHQNYFEIIVDSNRILKIKFVDKKTSYEALKQYNKARAYIENKYHVVKQTEFINRKSIMFVNPKDKDSGNDWIIKMDNFLIGASLILNNESSSSEADIENIESILLSLKEKAKE